MLYFITKLASPAEFPLLTFGIKPRQKEERGFTMIYVYLHQERMNRTKFETKSETTGGGKYPVERRNVLYYRGERIYEEDRNVHFMISGELDDGVPHLDWIPAAEISNITWYKNFRDVPARQRGVYRFQGAEAILDSSGSEGYYQLRLCKCKDLKDGQELYGRIREGNIWPAVSFENKQARSPIRHIRELLREVWSLIVSGIKSRFKGESPKLE